MDGQQFDGLTKAFAQGRSRRAVLRGLAGGVAAAVFGRTIEADAAPPTCRPAGRNCTQNANCCSGICDTTNPDPFKRFKCACPEGQVICNGACVAPCPEGTELNPATCQCQPICDEGQILCQNECVGPCPERTLFNPTTCQCDPICKVPITCTSTEQCCFEGQICALSPGLPGICCIPPGGSCETASECCGSATCSNSQCVIIIK